MNDSVSSEPPSKKIKVDETSDSSEAKSEGKNGASSTVTASDFSNLEIVRVLSCSDTNCSIAFEAKHKTEDGRVLVNMQKTPFDEKKLPEIVSGDTSLTQLFHNDVYSKHTAQITPNLNEVQITLIHPATDKHFVRFEKENFSVVEETPELYASGTKVFMESKDAHSKQWIHNILEGKSETERVIFKDETLDTGFTLLPDLKWTALQMSDLYCLALVQRRDISSIRDLRGEHLPLLRNIRDRGAQAIEDKYGVPRHRMRIYFHYLPSFYHLHIHFSALSFDAPGTRCGKAHMLADVISNIEMDSNYYAKATLSFVLKDNYPHPLARAETADKK